VHVKTVTLFLFFLAGCASAREERRGVYEAAIDQWYDAFNKKDPSLFDGVLSVDWVDTPSAPNQPRGPEGVKQVVGELTRTFPDLKVTVQEVLQDGNKVIVRSTITGTQKGAFMGLPTKNRALSIQAIDIHQLEDGKIVRTWHAEDWLTGLRQLGFLDK